MSCATCGAPVGPGQSCAVCGADAAEASGTARPGATPVPPSTPTPDATGLGVPGSTGRTLLPPVRWTAPPRPAVARSGLAHRWVVLIGVVGVMVAAAVYFVLTHH